MYNRYVPQPDGSFQKSRIREQEQHRNPPQPPPHPPCPAPECDGLTKPPPVSKGGIGAFDFLRQLLPKGLDTGDLLIIVLLLLMAGDSECDQSTALLTLALYLFL